MGIPNFENLALKFNAFNCDDYKESQIFSTTAINYVDSKFKIPDLKQYKQEKIIAKVFQSAQVNRSFNDLTDFMK